PESRQSDEQTERVHKLRAVAWNLVEVRGPFLAVTVRLPRQPRCREPDHPRGERWQRHVDLRREDAADDAQDPGGHRANSGRRKPVAGTPRPASASRATRWPRPVTV